ncbi:MULTISPECIES: type II toxin-antitoxin system death-on-curing family toxin [Microbacterium]|uniref:type II toxin-antitoxin system death-on-curing family toxin n=1 Tax=Microbacterium TaxID=33882 RepID=UPI00296F3229|nr:type II toxin-antitoxin system death-on-curing family toxin [Microbacterium liquefaciens]
MRRDVRRRRVPDVRSEGRRADSSVAQNHALFDGNKRISLYLTFIFIRLNGYEPTFTNDEAFDFVLDVAQSRLDLKQIAQVIAAHIREDTAR